MEDLVVHYDYSVRMSDGRVVQFRYGDDALDPIDMEGVCLCVCVCVCACVCVCVRWSVFAAR